eukprot:XP_002259513.1 KIR protein [Plasmodium knowlesi strain H]
MRRVFPSKVAESEINSSGDTSCKDGGSGSISSVEQTLKGHDDIASDAEDIAKYFCYVYEKKENISQDVSPCYYLYYYLGDLFYNSMESEDSFWRLMGIVSQQLGDIIGYNQTCKVELSKIKKDLFIWEKKVHDYYKDYTTIGEKLNTKNADTPCSEALQEYLRNAALAYGQIESYCLEPNGGGIEYCTKFSTTYKDLTLPNDLSSMCGSTSTRSTTFVRPEQTREQQQLIQEEARRRSAEAVTDGSTATTGSDSTIAPGAVAGGTIATIGLPTIGFFLYKYTNIFDGIKNSLFGGLNNGNNRRGRRSTGRHNFQHFDDTLTDNDSSTLGDDGSTTLGGGGGGGSSTLGGSSTDVSTIYNDGRGRPSPPKGRAGTNNRRQGNIRYYAT